MLCKLFSNELYRSRNDQKQYHSVIERAPNLSADGIMVNKAYVQTRINDTVKLLQTPKRKYNLWIHTNQASETVGADPTIYFVIQVKSRELNCA